MPIIYAVGKGIFFFFFLERGFVYLFKKGVEGAGAQPLSFLGTNRESVLHYGR